MTSHTPCDQCLAMMIQGCYCHEHGCPNADKTIKELREIRLREQKSIRNIQEALAEAKGEA